MNYNTQLCNTAWGKKLLAQVAKRTCFCSKNCDSNFFWSVGKGVTYEKCKTLFLPPNERNVLVIGNGISPSTALRTSYEANGSLEFRNTGTK